MALVFGYSIFQNQKKINLKSDTEDVVAPTPEALVPRAPQRLVAKSLSSPQLVTEDPAKNAEIEIEKTKLEDAKLKLDALIRARDQSINSVSTEIPDSITNNSTLIENLMSEMDYQRTEESRLDQVASQLKNETESTGRLTQEQIAPLIRNLELQVQQTQVQINSWQSATYITPIEKQARLQELQPTLDSLTTQLVALQNQHVEISAGIIQQSRDISNLVSQQKNDLVSNQAEIQEYIYSLRNEVGRLQQMNRQTRKNIANFQQQIDETQKLYQEQLQKVRTLEESITE